jgi:glycerate 2-kinase
MSNARPLVEKIFRAALREADPYRSVIRHTDEVRAIFGNGGFERLIVAGFGKGAVPMARAVETALCDLPIEGAIITTRCQGEHLGRMAVYEGGHPLPDVDGVAATEKLLRLAGNATEKTLLLCLVSGGGSALFVAPQPGITLAAKQATTSLLLTSGADIGELNIVRKHLSRVKGGRLAETALPATIVTLLLSDVVGDRLDVIASGPTVPDPTTYGDALDVLGKYHLMNSIPRPVKELLVRGKQGLCPETPKPGDPLFDRVRNILVGTNRLALAGARRAAEAEGIGTDILSAEISGEAREAGRQLARTALATRRKMAGQAAFCLLSGGETTVTVTGNGKGGRNMELALAFALEIEGVPGITLLSGGTDGADGPTDAAGAVVDGLTSNRARERGIDPIAALRNNDSYSFFQKAGGLLVTGPTGTNVMDLQIVLIEQEQ